MNVNLNSPFDPRFGTFYSDDETSGSPEFESSPEPVNEAAHRSEASEAAASAPTLGLSVEELDRRIESGIMSAVRKLQEQSEPAYPPQTQYQLQTQYQPQGNYFDPVRQAFSVQREHTRMHAEAMDLYDDLPDEYKRKIEQQLDQVPLEQIPSFRREGYHRTIANAIMAEALNEGKYVPKRLGRSSAPLREPVGGGSSTLNSRDPHKSAFDQEISELESLLFKNLTPEQRAKVKFTDGEKSLSQRPR